MQPTAPTAPPTQAAPLDLASLVLYSGSHTQASGQFCLYEAVSRYEGQTFTHRPAGVCATLWDIGLHWNDTASAGERQELKQYIPFLAKTDLGQEVAAQRAWMYIDWTFRSLLPMILGKNSEYEVHAAALKALSPITDEPALSLAMPAINQALDLDLARARDLALALARARALDPDLKKEIQQSKHQIFQKMIDFSLEENPKSLAEDV